MGEKFRSVRSQSVAIAELFSEEDRLLQAMPQASPIKWHLAHTTWFFETFVLRTVSGYTAVDERYHWLFNSYYNAIGPQPNRAERGLWSRPNLSEVAAYRVHVDAAVAAAIGEMDAEALQRLDLGLHHEQQHQELMLTDTLAGLAKNPLQPCAIPWRAGPLADEPARAAPLEYRRFNGGLVEVGYRGPGFHFDNETPQHTVHLAAFELASRPLCNADVIAFIDAGGYRRPEFWLSDGFDWVQSSNRQLPCYWSRGVHGYQHYTLHGLIPLDLARTASHLSFFEADAIARFFDARLPTEAEWEHAARSYRRDSEATSRRPDQRLPVEWLPQVAGAEALAQLFGTVWEWTSSAYGAYPRFQPSAGAIGEYNGKFMHGQYVLRGGSLATPAGHVRASYRNFFPATACWQFSGVRLARNAH